jgi:hypothetical protein
MTTTKRPSSYGPIQLCEHLGIAQWQLERAVEMGLVPHADRSPRRWSTPVADDVQARLEEILTAIGTVSNRGGILAAEYLADKFGPRVSPDTVAELSRMGHLAEVGDYKGHPLYSGRDLEAFTDVDALAAAADRGRLMMTDPAAAYLGCRPSDFGHLVRAHWIEPAKWVHGEWDRRDHPTVALYRKHDLDVLLAHPAIDWDAVRAVPKGGRSPFASLARSR